MSGPRHQAGPHHCASSGRILAIALAHASSDRILVLALALAHAFALAAAFAQLLATGKSA